MKKTLLILMLLSSASSGWAIPIGPTDNCFGRVKFHQCSESYEIWCNNTLRCEAFVERGKCFGRAWDCIRSSNCGEDLLTLHLARCPEELPDFEIPEYDH